MNSHLTVNKKDPMVLSKAEAIEYCYTNKQQFLAQVALSGDDPTKQFDCLLAIIECDTIKPHQITDYGMSDQDLELE